MSCINARKLARKEEVKLGAINLEVGVREMRRLEMLRDTLLIRFEAGKVGNREEEDAG